MSSKQQKPPYPLRMPDDLKDQLKSAADHNHRSLNAEIVARLQESFEKPATRPMQDSDLDVLLDLLQARAKERERERKK